MKKLIAFSLLASMLALSSCETKEPQPPPQPAPLAAIQVACCLSDIIIPPEPSDPIKFHVANCTSTLNLIATASSSIQSMVVVDRIPTSGTPTTQTYPLPMDGTPGIVNFSGDANFEVRVLATTPLNMTPHPFTHAVLQQVLNNSGCPELQGNYWNPCGTQQCDFYSVQVIVHPPTDTLMSFKELFPYAKKLNPKPWSGNGKYQPQK